MAVHVLNKYKMWWYFKKCCHIQNTGLKTLFRGAKKSLKKQEGHNAANVMPFILQQEGLHERQIYTFAFTR